MPIPIDAQSLLGRRDADVQSQVAERPFFDLQQRRSPPLFDLRRSVICPDGFDPVTRALLWSENSSRLRWS